MTSEEFDDNFQIFKDDVDKLDTLLASQDFDEIKFVNHEFPTQDSLDQLPQKIRHLQDRQKRIHETIKKSIRSYGVLGDKSEQILNDTVQTIQTLATKIKDIHNQAVKTEDVVTEICGSIKPLNNAKTHLSTSIRALENIKLINVAVNSLDDSILQRNYKECGMTISSVSDLLKMFDKYKDTPQLKPLFDKFAAQKSSLRDQITSNFNETLFKGSADESFIDICLCIDAFNDDFHNYVVNLFCERFLSSYDTAFELTETTTELNYDGRFTWFKNRMEFFQQKYSKAFPEEWAMNYQLSQQFCQKTCGAFKAILAAQGTPNIKEYLSSFEKTVKFEDKLAKEFSRLVVLPFDPNAIMPDFGNDAEGIRQKYAWRKRQEQGIGEVITQEAKEFKGSITCAFAPHLNLYLNSEGTKYSQIISKSGKGDDYENETDKKLKSEGVLILAMKATIDKCTGFGDAQSLQDLFVVLKDKLGEYAQMLTKCMSSLSNQIKKKQIFGGKVSNVSSMDEDDRNHITEIIHKQCYLVNTSTDVLDVIGSLCNKIQSIVPEDIREAIIITDSLETIGNEIQNQMQFFVKTIIKLLSIQLEKIGNNSWVETDPSLKLPKDLVDNINFIFDIIDSSLYENNKKLRFTPIFSAELVKAIQDSLYKTRNLNEADRIVTSVKELKTIVLQKTQVVRLAEQQVNKVFNNLDSLLTVLHSPEIAMVPVYLEKMGKSASKEEFMNLVKLRGLGLEQEIELSKEFEKQFQSQ